MNTSHSSSTTTSAMMGPAFMIVGAIAVGYAPIGLRLSEFDPQATAFWRFVLAIPILAVLAIRCEGGIRPPSVFSLLTGLFFGLDIAIWHAALVETSVANATFIVNLGAIAVGLLAWIVLKERPARLWPIAALIAVAGAWLLSSGASQGGAGSMRGDIIACFAACALAFYFLFGKMARRDGRPINIIFWATFASAGVTLVSSLIMGERLIPASPQWLAAPLSLAIIAHAAGQTLILAGLGRTSAGLAGLLILFQPITSAIAAAGLFDEQLGPVQLFGAALILLGVWLAGRR